MSSSDPTQVLADVAGLFGVELLKEKQDEAIRTVLSGRDTFVSLPTGYGKSIIYAALPLIFDRLLDRKGSRYDTSQFDRAAAIYIYTASICVRVTITFIIVYHIRFREIGNKNGIGC